MDTSHDTGGDSGDSGASGDSGDSGDSDTGEHGGDSGDSDTGEDTADVELHFVGDISLDEADVTVVGDEPNMDLGRAMAVGDLTGDGVADLVSGLYLMDGQTGGGAVLPGPVTEGGEVGDVGFQILGTVAGTGMGRSVALGDVDGDGFMDVGLGGPFSGTSNGLYLNFGPVMGEVSAGGDDGAVLLGPRAGYSGHGSDLADVDGDGVEDAVVGCYYAGSLNGVTYIERGPISDDLTLEDDADVALVGEPNSYAGRIVRAGMDMDGDGVGDVAIGALGTLDLRNGGGAYVALGPFTDDLDLADADGRYSGVRPDTYAGLWLDAGDVDGDGLGDLVVAAYDSTVAVNGGAFYVVLGPASAHDSLSSAEITFLGDRPYAYGGNIAVGDLDLDGGADLLLGAYVDSTAASAAGAAYLFVGPSPGSYVFTDADATFYGASSAVAVGSGHVIGDLSDDGVPDVVIGAPGVTTGRVSGGAVGVFMRAP